MDERQDRRRVTTEWQRTGLLATFAGFPARVADAIHETAGTPIPPGEWGAAENVRHLIAVERLVWHVRFVEVLTRADAHWSWKEPGQEPGMDDVTIDDIVSAFAAVRAETVATVRGITDDDWTRSGTHDSYGVLDVAGLVRLAIDHDAEHLRGIVSPA
jgi:hypothetical protein